jgi:hypothetical protein
VNGSSLTFTASVVNEAALNGVPMTFVWKWKGIEVGTGSMFTIGSVTDLNAGLYEVVVSTAAYGRGVGSTLLQVASIDILSQPIGVTALPGVAVELNVVARASESGLTYKWRRNGVTLQEYL